MDLFILIICAIFIGIIGYFIYGIYVSLIQKTPQEKIDDMRKLDNQDKIVKIAKKDSDYDVRSAAVRKISDEVVLADIVKNDSSSYVRREAVEKISDESVLIDVVKNDEDADVRRKAVEKISDESVLIDVAKNDSSIYVIRDAVKKINDEDFLSDLVVDGPAEVRAIAIEKLNKDVLVDIVCNRAEWEVAMDCVDKIANESILAEIAKKTSSQNVCSSSIDKISSVSLLKDIAKDASNDYGSQLANDKLNVLEKLESGDIDERLNAIDALNDIKILEDIANNDSDKSIRIAALKRIPTDARSKVMNKFNLDTLIEYACMDEPLLNSIALEEAVNNYLTNDGLLKIIYNASSDGIKRQAINHINSRERLYSKESFYKTYTCSSCNEKLFKDAKSCPFCGVHLSGEKWV